jgi:hypothetical protein
MNKAKAAGVSASSFFDLKAELSKYEDEFAKKKAAGLSTAIIGGIKRPQKVRVLSIPHYTLGFISCPFRNLQFGRVKTQE